MPLRIVFMGTPDFAVPALEQLHATGHQIVACYTQPPRPAGRRGLELKKSPVHERAEAFGIKVLTPTSLKDEHEQLVFKNHNADVGIVIAYGLILPKAVLDAPVHGCFNGHASLLPRWRGAAPIQRAIMTGDEETGVCIMKMDVGLDTGPIAIEERTAISENMTAAELHDVLAELTAGMMVKAMEALEQGSINLAEQDAEGILYAEKISKSESRIDWNKPAKTVHNHIRGLSPFPGAWCEMQIAGTVQRVKILKSELADGAGAPGTFLQHVSAVACGNGAVRLVKVQRAGKQAQSGEEFLRGNKIEAVF